MTTGSVPSWSTTAANNGTADPAVNFAEGMAPSAVNDSARALMASVAKWRNDLYGITTSGSSTAYTATTGANFATPSEMSGAVFSIVPHATSGAAPTLSVDGLTARAINFSTGVAIPAGALLSGTPYLVKYVHATTEFIVVGGAGALPLSSLDIINGTSLTAPALGDTLPIYDVSATANRRVLLSDVLNVINGLTADSSPDRANDYVVTYDTSASAAKKVLLQNVPSSLPRGYIDGCKLSNDTDATNDINVLDGVCRDITNAVDITVPAISGKQLDANWATGGSAGMRYSGAGIANGTYGIFAVRTAASATADIYAYPLTAGTDADTTSFHATVLAALQAESGGSSYAYVRRIGSILRESNAIVRFIQLGDSVVRQVAKKDLSGNGISTAAARLLSVPLGIRVEAHINGFVSSGNNGFAVYFYCPDIDEPTVTASDGPATVIIPTGSATQTSSGYNDRVWTNLSGQVNAKASNGVIATLWTAGWIDPRGRGA